MLRSATIALLLIALAGMVTTVVVRSQSQTADVEVRVRAKRLADGRTEFAVQQRQDNDWSESLFSSNPKLTADPVTDRWYNSRAVSASVDIDAQPSAAATRPDPPRGWTSLGDTGDAVRIDLRYSVEPDVIDGSLTTVVSSFARGDEYGFEYVKLSVVCDGGDLDLVVDDDEFHFSNTPAEVTLRVGAGTPQTFTWPRFRGAANGFSPADDRAFIRLLQSADQVTTQIKEGSTTTAQVVDLVGFFSTPAQPNIEHCGGSAPSGVSLLGGTGGEIEINLKYTVTADVADGVLTTVVETWVSDESYNSSYIYLVCDRGRFDVVLYITDGTYSTPSWTPTTTVRLDEGAAQEFRWPNMRGVKNGISPDDDFAFLDRIRLANSLALSVNHGTAAAGTTFGLTGLLSTRAQGNIDYCGQY